jgi:YegS/Rv2252/BmrU family lipid kinase
MKPRRQGIAIFNPHTGRLPGDKIAWLIEKIVEREWDVDFRFTQSPEEVTELAREAARESDAIIAIGGDGTVAAVAAGLLDTDARLYIIPNGSTNVIARGLGIPGDPIRAGRALLGDMETRWIDVAMSGKRAILHMAGSGFDSLMFRDTQTSFKRLFAWLAYVPPAVRHLGDRPWRYRLKIDHTEIETDARMVLVANGDFVIHPRFRIGRGIRIDDGYLDVCVFRPPHLMGALSLATWIALGRGYRSRYTTQYKATSVSVDSEPPAPVEFDGDYVGTTPFEVTIRPRALPVMVPLSRVRAKRTDLERAMPSQTYSRTPTIT